MKEACRGRSGFMPIGALSYGVHYHLQINIHGVNVYKMKARETVDSLLLHKTIDIVYSTTMVWRLPRLLGQLSLIEWVYAVKAINPTQCYNHSSA